MVWKCSKCKFKSQSYQAMQRHYYKNHHKSKAKKASNKGKDKKVHVFRPTLKK